MRGIKISFGHPVYDHNTEVDITRHENDQTPFATLLREALGTHQSRTEIPDSLYESGIRYCLDRNVQSCVVMRGLRNHQILLLEPSTAPRVHSNE